MIIYIETQAKDYPQTKKILKKFPNADIVWIKNFKNIFDKNIPFNMSLKPSFIIAKLNSPAILKAPSWYWHNNSQAFFLKTSLNCVFDCDYCFLKWAFKNDIPVYFVNYEDIKKQIIQTIENVKKSNNLLDCYKKAIWFYSSDYSDILWMNWISWFVEEFVPFFEQFENVMMEIRTKSTAINSLLNLNFVPKNTEIAFSLNPQILIEKYEKWTASLDDRINAINTLVEKWFKVWLRFLPCLPVKNYQEIYTQFVEYIKWKIDFEKISSIFVSWLLYTKEDYKNILKKMPNLDVLYFLEDDDWTFIRASKQARKFFYKLFKPLHKQSFICLDTDSI